MNRVMIPGTTLESSRLGFGTASLHHLPTAAARARLLAVAYDSGITHFDTARMYGDGIAERALGAWLKGRPRDAVTVATKCGILPNRLAEHFPPWVYLRRVARRLIPTAGSEQPQRSYTPEAVRRSVEQSLRMLGTDYLDILFIHDPRREELRALQSLSGVLENLKKSGKIRYVGIAGDSRICIEAKEESPGLFDILQVGDSFARREADALATIGWPLQITFGYLRDVLSGRTSTPSSGPEVVRQALDRNSSGVVLVSSRKVVRLGELIEAASDA
jgi:aryl-alcohol dehydrogenase-like predicted oxidoreductase